jgi:hypothetical protein
VLYALTALFVVATVALVADGEAQDRLLTITIVAREVTTLLFLGVFVVAVLAVRAGRAAPTT